MKIVYICSPYSGYVEYNVTMAKAYCAIAATEGVVPYAPHLLFPQFLKDDVPEDRKLALEMCMEMLRVADELWVCGNEITEGMRGEIEEAQRLGKPVMHVFPKTGIDFEVSGVEK